VRQLKSIRELHLGDTIRHRSQVKADQVVYLGGDYVIAIRAVHISNPDEWLVEENQAQVQAQAQAPKGVPISFELTVAIENLIDAKVNNTYQLQRTRNILEETIKLALGSSDHVS